MRICYEKESYVQGRPCALKLSSLMSNDQLFFQCVRCLDAQARDRNVQKLMNPVTVKPKTVYTDWGRELMEDLDAGKTDKYFEKYRGKPRWKRR